MAVPRVTVLLPAFNSGDYLAETLESIWKQTFADFELLAVDDGSTDRSPEILASCCDKRLRVLRNASRLKLSGALNRGLGEARGEFVARMDADDLMRPDRLERQLAHLGRHPEIGCCGGWVRTHGEGSGKIRRYPEGAEQVKAFALFYTPFAHPTVMFRREWFEREKLSYEGSYYPTEDYELWSRAVFQFPCDNLQQILVDYRVHGKSMTGGEWTEMDAQTVRVHAGIIERLGFAPSADELRLHRGASMGLLPATAEVFDSVERWLCKLADANRQNRVFEIRAMEDVINYVWFRHAMAGVRKMGSEACKLYRKSPLADYGAQACKRRWTVRVAALKAILSGCRA